MEARPRARRRPLVGDRRSPRRRRVGGDGRTRHRLAPSHRLASSVARLLGSNTLPGALGQPRELSSALPEGGSGRATARNHAMLDAAAAALPSGQTLGRAPGAGGARAAATTDSNGPELLGRAVQVLEELAEFPADGAA